MGQSESDSAPDERKYHSMQHDLAGRRPWSSSRVTQRIIWGTIFLYLLVHSFNLNFYWGSGKTENIRIQAQREALRAHCASLHTPAGPPPDFNPVTRRLDGNDRFVPGTKPVLFRNAKIWTGGRNGTETIHGDLFIAKGVVQAVGYVPQNLINKFERGSLEDRVHVVDAQGRWITPGLVDLHSHIGVGSAPALSGTLISISFRTLVLVPET